MMSFPTSGRGSERVKLIKSYFGYNFTGQSEHKLQTFMKYFGLKYQQQKQQQRQQWTIADSLATSYPAKILKTVNS